MTFIPLIRTTIILRTCIGPSMTKAHVRQVGSESPLTLCESTRPTVDYTGKLLTSKLCQRCGKKAMELLCTDVLMPADIGVKDFV